MSEKILGFRKEDIEWIDGGTIRIGTANPVPVVSLARLEKSVKELEDLLHIAEMDFHKKEVTYVITSKKFDKWKENLLSDAKKEANA